MSRFMQLYLLLVLFCTATVWPQAENAADDAEVSETETILQSQLFTLPETGILRLHIYGEEQTLALQGTSKQILAANGRVVQNQYDSSARIQKRLVWDSPGKESLQPISVISYTYAGDEPFAQSATELRYREKRRLETVFNRNRQPVSIHTYVYDPDTMTVVDKTQRRKDKNTLKDGALLCAESFEYTKDGVVLLYIRINYENTVANKYEEKYFYTEKSSSPDFQIYENDELRRCREYESDDLYVETVFFENNFSARIFYENGFRLREEFRHRDAVVGSKTYPVPQPEHGLEKSAGEQEVSG